MLGALFARAGVPCRVPNIVRGELWLKMIINCAYNAISALGRAQYHRAAGNRWTRELMIKVTEEALEVARAAGVQLPDVDMVETVLKISESMANATSSTAQDLARGKPTEIDSLNGYLVRRGRGTRCTNPRQSDPLRLGQTPRGICPAKSKTLERPGWMPRTATAVTRYVSGFIPSTTGVAFLRGARRICIWLRLCHSVRTVAEVGISAIEQFFLRLCSFGFNNFRLP